MAKCLVAALEAQDVAIRLHFGDSKALKLLAKGFHLRGEVPLQLDFYLERRVDLGLLLCPQRAIILDAFLKLLLSFLSLEKYFFLFFFFLITISIGFLLEVEGQLLFEPLLILKGIGGGRVSPAANKTDDVFLNKGLEEILKVKKRKRERGTMRRQPWPLLLLVAGMSRTRSTRTPSMPRRISTNVGRLQN